MIQLSSLFADTWLQYLSLSGNEKDEHCIKSDVDSVTRVISVSAAGEEE